ncbi:Oidioi.mRNA.OKI2018_I69.chr1.g3004.t2.cds [Oikopleura dioica]|uniref:Oidioi.mRNA.OKI2018_I69.chr1.g3004.t2.cds n=1 Tax=Oikopleura dioica TaxID=34765 RepID=A0ABN7SX59_OIKDI|nr:Oidioi.mRNA.OKI2018_I69.chr1.g3004.t2.cds [Oikopleura dioica]
MCLSLSAETSPRIKSFVYSLHVSVIFILIAAFELTETEDNKSLRKGIFLVSLGLTLLSLLYVRAKFSPGLWDEETNTEGREDTGPKPPTYENILESNAEVFKRMAIDDPEAPPPTIGTGLRIGIPVNDDYKPPNYIQSEGEPPSFIESTGIIEVQADGTSILESQGNLGMFDAKRHRKEQQKQAIKNQKMGQKFGATSLVDSAFKAVPIEEFDILTEDRQFIFHNFWLEVRHRSLNCFNFYMEQNYTSVIKISSLDDDIHPSAIIKDDENRIIGKINPTGDKSRGDMKLEALPRDGYVNMCLFNVNGGFAAAEIGVEIMIVFTPGKSPFGKKMTLPNAEVMESASENAEEEMELLELVRKFDDLVAGLRVKMFSAWRTIQQMKIFHHGDEISQEHQSDMITNWSLFQVGVMVLVVFLQELHLPLNLDRLYASKNDLQNLSDISNLCSITEVDLSSNDLKYIEPGDLTCMAHLISVSLSQNWIGDVDEDLFRNLTEITSIQMANMNLHSLPVTIFRDNTLLSSLDLSNNRIKTIPTNLFANNQNLAFLDLSLNQITTLSPEVFLSCPKLTQMFLRDNELTVAHSSWFRAFYYKSKFRPYIDLSGNPWSCACSMISFRAWRNRNKWFMDIEGFQA